MKDGATKLLGSRLNNLSVFLRVSDLYGSQVVCISCIPLTLNRMLLLSRLTFGSEEITSDINISKNKNEMKEKLGSVLFMQKKRRLNLCSSADPKFYSRRLILSGNYKNVICIYTGSRLQRAI